MGNCFTARKKAEIHNVSAASGVNSRSSSKDGNRSSSSGSTPRSEGEILQSTNAKSFAFNDLKLATRNFRPDSLLGEGGFGCVFKGWIDEHALTATKPGTGVVIAVKMRRFDQVGSQGHKKWLTEVKYLGQLYHPNLVKLIGYCLEDEHGLLVYEFMPHGSLENHLFRRGSYFQPLSWNLRMKVALGAAKGLAFLHSLEIKDIYHVFNTSNILLDTDYNAKLSDFGLAKDGDESISPFVYAAPEFPSKRLLTAKSDVYSFGVVLLEMLTGRRALDSNRPPGEHNLVEWARPHLSSKRRIFKVLDSRLEGQYTVEGAQKVGVLALQCLSPESRLRPSMNNVVSSLGNLQDSKGPEGQSSAEQKGIPQTLKVPRGKVAYPRPSSSPLYT